MFQNQKWTNCFLMIVSAIFMSLAFYSPAGAANCGNIPCHCGDTLTANRTLVSGVDPIIGAACQDNGLVMNTPDVVLNLGGNKIVGSGDFVGILISADGVTVKNGGVDNFETGIGGATNDSTIDGIRPNVNTGDGISLQGNGNDLLNILAKRSGNNGVTVIGNNNWLEGHNDEYNGFDGIHVVGDGNVLFDNTASENRKKGPGAGVIVIGNNNRLEENRITKMNTWGIVIDGDQNQLIKNQVVKQDQDGITVNGADNVLTDNKATGNKKFGIIVVGDDISAAAASTGNIVSQNRGGNPQCSIYGVTTAPTCIQK